MLMLVAASAALLPAAFFMINRVRRRKQLEKDLPPYPPGPKPSLLLGNIPDLTLVKKSGVAYLGNAYIEWTKTYGKVFSITVPFSGRMIVVCDPKFAKEVLITKNYPKSSMYNTVAPLLGSESMVLLSGERWAPKRRAFNPGFGPNFLKNMVRTMAEKLKRFIECIEEDISGEAGKDGVTDLLYRAQTFTSDVIVSVAFGEDWGGKNPHPARLWISQITDLCKGMSIRLGTLLFGFRTKLLIKYYEKLLDQEMMNILERRLAAGVSDNSKDICSIAINQLKDKDGNLTKADKISITHQLKTFYFAGHDTTATTISWAIWSLSQHEEILRKVRAELNDHGIWNDLENPPTYEQLQDCTYLEAVLKETLRLYPPAGSGRYVQKLDETLGGYRVGGSHVFVSPYVIHRHPDLWKNPNDFRPDRFLDGSEGDLQEKFLPFMRGPRDCLGKYFALLEAKLAVSSLVTRFDVECVDPNDEPVNQVTLVPKNGTKVRFSDRK